MCGGPGKDACGICGDGSTCTASITTTIARTVTTVTTTQTTITTTNAATTGISFSTTTNREGEENVTTTITTVTAAIPTDAAAAVKRKGSRAGIAVAVTLLLLAIVLAAVWWIRRDRDANPIADYIDRSVDNALYGSAAEGAADGQERARGAVQLTPNVMYAVPLANEDGNCIVPSDGAASEGSRVSNNVIYQPSAPDVALTQNVMYIDAGPPPLIPQPSVEHSTVDATQVMYAVPMANEDDPGNYIVPSDGVAGAGSTNALSPVYAIPTEDGDVIHGDSGGNIVTLPSHAAYEGYTVNALSPVYAIPTEDGDVIHGGSSGNIVTLPSHAAYEGYTPVETNDAGAVNAMNDEPASFRGRANTEC